MDYQNKIWGGSQVRLSLNYLGYRRLKYLLRSINDLKPNSKVLEIGCGGGGFIASVKFYKPGLNYFANDISVKAIRFASKKYKNINFSVGDIYNIEFPKNYFDAVIIADVLEHIDNPNLAISEINRVLKKGGLFHSYVPLEGETFTLHNLFTNLGFNLKEKYAGHIQNYKFIDLKKLFLKNKFKIVNYYYELYLIGQVVDLGYFSYLNATNSKINTGLEQKLSNNKLLNFLKNILTIIVNIESELFTNFKGAGVHISAIKK